MKKLDLILIVPLVALFGFFIATAHDRVRYVVSIVPIIVVLVIVFRNRKR